MPMFKRPGCGTAVLAGWLWSASVIASGIPTVDVANVLQNLEQAREMALQRVEMARQVTNQVQMIRHQVEQIKQLRGNFGLHTLLNDWEYRRARRLIPSTYKNTRALFRVGMNLPEKTGLNALRRAALDEAVTQASAGDVLLTRADDLVTETELLTASIADHEQTKAALDLANRLAAQGQLIMAEALRAQAIALSTGGRQAAQRVANVAADARAGLYGGFARRFQGSP